MRTANRNSPYIIVVFGGDEEDRTPGLGIANAALPQLSYIPKLLKVPLLLHFAFL